MNPMNSPTFQPLPGLFEPSAIQQLPDGRFLVVEDEKSHPFSLLDIHPDGRVESAPVRPGWFQGGGAFWNLDDLEGLTLGPDGYLYAITSHSRDGDGDEKSARDKLVRFRIDGDGVKAASVVKNLKPALRAAHPALDAAAAVLDVKTAGGLNIEALEFDPIHALLLVGLRSPLLEQRAIIATLENPAALFEDDEPARVTATLIRLDLAGAGIRGLAHVSALGGYLLIAGPVSRSTEPFQLWFWNGQPDQAPRRVSVPGLDGYAHAEGVCQAVVGGRTGLLLVSDEGNRKLGRPARYVWLTPEQLVIAP